MKHLLAWVLTIAMALTLCACGEKTESEPSEAPLTWQEQYDLGVRYLSEGNYAEAIIAFTAAIEIDSQQVDAYVNRAAVYVEMNEFDLAIADYEAAIEIEASNERLYLMAAELCIAYDRTDLAIAFLQRGAEKTSSEEIYTKLNSLVEEILSPTQAEFVLDAVSTQPFLTSSGIDIYPFPDESFGWVNSHVADVDLDGQLELVSLFATSKGLIVWKHEVESDGTVSSTELGTIQGPSYCSQMDVTLFYSADLGRYCIAASDVPVGAYTGTQALNAWLYTIEPDSLVRHQAWDWASIIHGWERLDEIKAEMENLGWPYLETYYLSVTNENSLESCAWLLRTEVTIADGMTPTDYVQYLRFLSPEELAVLPTQH